MNGMANWHGTTWMWVDRLLDPVYMWPWSLTSFVIFTLDFLRSKFQIAISVEPGRSLCPLRNLWLWHQPWLYIEFVGFQDEILILLHFRNGLTLWYKARRIWLDRIMITLCDLTHGHGLFRLNFENNYICEIISNFTSLHDKTSFYYSFII